MSDTHPARPKVPFDQNPPLSLRFLYRTIPGRVLLWGLTRRWVSGLAGVYLRSPLSAGRINRFVRKNRICLQDYEQTSYRSFNDFFTRRIVPSARPIDLRPDSLISPCDAKLSAYQIRSDATFLIKNAPYRVADLIADEEIARQYNGGMILIFRLAVEDYHRYSYFDDCVQGAGKIIPGELHTVQPVALERYNFFVRNCREWCVLRTVHFGEAVQVEIGALMVGRIRNTGGEGFHARGEEKGYFEFGGSTIALLLLPGAASVDREILINTAEGYETVVKYGGIIGKRLDRSGR